jgi:hypothetical protein
MQYDVLTIDTQVIHANGFDLEGGLLAQIAQFRDGSTRFVLSRVTLKEILRHLTEKAEETRRGLQSAFRKARDGQFPLELPDLKAIDPKAVARSRLEAFVKATGAEIIDYDQVSLPEVMDRYFKPAPPFATGKKKNEFSDAVALLSLEAWAEAKGKRVLAVSNDGDWTAFAEASAVIDVQTDLSDALADLQKNSTEAVAIVIDLLRRIKTDDDWDLRAGFYSSLDSEIAGYSASAEAESYHSVEGEDVNLTFLDFDFAEDPEDEAFEVVQARPDYLVVQVDLKVKVRAEGSFTFQIYDSIDKDYVNLGSSLASTEDELELAALVTFERDDDQAEKPWMVHNVELLGHGEAVDFGYIEPDYSRERDDNDYGR